MPWLLRLVASQLHAGGTRSRASALPITAAQERGPPPIKQSNNVARAAMGTPWGLTPWNEKRRRKSVGHHGGVAKHRHGNDTVGHRPARAAVVDMLIERSSCLSPAYELPHSHNAHRFVCRRYRCNRVAFASRLYVNNYMYASLAGGFGHLDP